MAEIHTNDQYIYFDECRIEKYVFINLIVTQWKYRHNTK